MAPKARREGRGSCNTGSTTSRKAITTMKLGKISHTYTWERII